MIIAAPNVHDVTPAADLLHGQETDAWADVGYQSVQKREEYADSKVYWHIAKRC